jgi:hypothetical protein
MQVQELFVLVVASSVKHSQAASSSPSPGLQRRPPGGSTCTGHQRSAD